MNSLSLTSVNGSRTGSFPKSGARLLADRIAQKKYPMILCNVSKDKRPSIQYYFAKYPCFVFSPGLADGRSKVRWTGKKKSVGVSAYSHARYHRVEEEGYSPFSSLSFLICSSTAFIFWASSDSSSRNLSAFFLARSTRLLPFLLLLVRKHRLFS